MTPEAPQSDPESRPRRSNKRARIANEKRTELRRSQDRLGPPMEPISKIGTPPGLIWERKRAPKPMPERSNIAGKIKRIDHDTNKNQHRHRQIFLWESEGSTNGSGPCSLEASTSPGSPGRRPRDPGSRHGNPRHRCVHSKHRNSNNDNHDNDNANNAIIEL